MVPLGLPQQDMLCMLLLSTGGFKGIVQQDGGSCIAWWCGGFLHSQQANLAGPKQLLGVQIECSLLMLQWMAVCYYAVGYTDSGDDFTFVHSTISKPSEGGVCVHVCMCRWG
jgi:hypothetical protein